MRIKVSAVAAAFLGQDSRSRQTWRAPAVAIGRGLSGFPGAGAGRGRPADTRDGWPKGAIVVHRPSLPAPRWRGRGHCPFWAAATATLFGMGKDSLSMQGE